MSTNGQTYVLDNNTLASLTRDQRASAFFREHCRIPSEVLFEARGLRDVATLTALEYPTTPRVLAALTEVMATVAVGDTALVNLYANKGNADPLLVACALDGRRTDQEFLWGPDWVVVSGDKAVRAKAEDFGIVTMTNDEFVSMLEDRVRLSEA